MFFADFLWFFIDFTNFKFLKSNVFMAKHGLTSVIFRLACLLSNISINTKIIWIVIGINRRIICLIDKIVLLKSWIVCFFLQTYFLNKLSFKFFKFTVSVYMRHHTIINTFICLTFLNMFKGF